MGQTFVAPQRILKIIPFAKSSDHFLHVSPLQRHSSAFPLRYTTLHYTTYAIFDQSWFNLIAPSFILCPQFVQIGGPAIPSILFYFDCAKFHFVSPTCSNRRTTRHYNTQYYAIPYYTMLCYIIRYIYVVSYRSGSSYLTTLWASVLQKF